MTCELHLKKRISRIGFFGWTAIWVAGLSVLNLIHQVSSGFFEGGIWRPGEVLAQFPGWVGLFLPFAAFAGGLATHALLPVSSVLNRGVLIAVVSYLLLAYGLPITTYIDGKNAGVDVAVLYPFGPATPGGLLARRSAIEADPPENYGFRVEDPLSRPPNWLTYLLHSVIVIAVFSVFSALLGHLAGKLTTGLSPPNRRNARWALGLAGAIAFFLAEAVGGDSW